MATVAEQDQLAQANIAGQTQLQHQASAAVAAAWLALPRHDDAHVTEFVTAATRVVLAAQLASVNLVNAFLAAVMDRQPLSISTADLVGAAVRNGTTPSEVYHRPFVTTWTKLSEGKSPEDAMRAGLHRAMAAAETDVQLAMRATVREVATADKNIVGYARVPDPTACPLCLIASTQRYHKSDLLPIHPHCRCGVIPLTVERGQVINPDLLKKLKADGELAKITRQRQRARTRNADGLPEDTVLPAPKLTVAIREHGELGPILTNADDHFTGPGAIAA